MMYQFRSLGVLQNLGLSLQTLQNDCKTQISEFIVNEGIIEIIRKGLTAVPPHFLALIPFGRSCNYYKLKQKKKRKREIVR